MPRHRLSKMKRLEIVVETQRLPAFVSIVQSHATGYTTVPGIHGLGEHGLHTADLTLLVTITIEEHLDKILDAILPLLNDCSNIVTISDVNVLRPEHFIPEVRAASKSKSG